MTDPSSALNRYAVIEITMCRNCPEYGTTGKDRTGWCKRELRDIRKFGQRNPPDWCPLPTIKPEYGK